MFQQNLVFRISTKEVDKNLIYKLEKFITNCAWLNRKEYRGFNHLEFKIFHMTSTDDIPESANIKIFPVTEQWGDFGYIKVTDDMPKISLRVLDSRHWDSGSNTHISNVSNLNLIKEIINNLQNNNKDVAKEKLIKLSLDAE